MRIRKKVRKIPTKVVKKWIMYIIIRPSVGPFTTGRMRVLVK